MSELSVSKLSSQTTNTPPVIEDDSANEVGQFCRAWVNFNGVGVVAIRDSFNVSSITDNGIGDYTVNFTNAMANTNYVEAIYALIGFSYSFALETGYVKAAGSLRFIVGGWNGTAAANASVGDSLNTNVSIFANN